MKQPPINLLNNHLSDDNRLGNDSPNGIEKEIEKLVQQYFATSKKSNGGFLYQELIQRIERTLIASVMKYTHQNQSQTATILGISRTTLRKKLLTLKLL